MKSSCLVMSVVASIFVCPLRAHAHGSFNMLISSTASGGGALQVEYDFSTVARLGFSTSLGGFSIYTGLEPAFELLAEDEPAEPSFVVSNGTDISVEITAIDFGKTSMKVGSTVLAAVGDSALFGTVPFDHVHPELQLQLMLPEGEFGEGTISFKITTTSGAYTESEPYVLKLSNGPLPPLDYDPTAFAKDSVKCQQTVGKVVKKLIGKEFGILSKCLDKVQVFKAKSELTTPPSDLAKAQATAEQACADASGTGPDSKTVLGQLAAARAAAATAIADACSGTGSGDLSDDDISQQIGFASCHVEQLAAGAYGGAKTELAEFTARASQGGATLDTYFPCLYATASE